MSSEKLPSHSAPDIAKDHSKEVDAYSTDDSSIGKGDILSREVVDPALTAKMSLVNDAIDEIGWTGYHSKLFVLNGFGYAVDSLILLIQSIVQPQVALEMKPSFDHGLTIAVYVGMFTGALFWGSTADIIGRRTAFNVSLFICSIFAIVAGASPSYPVLGLFVALAAFGAGGNLILDTAVFLEFLPSSKQWLLTLLAAWWGVGQMVAGLIAWPFMSDYSCSSAATCTKANNMGWRYLWYTCGSLVLVMSILRVTVIRLHETPKFLLSQGRDEDVVNTLQSITKKYNRTCSLTVDQLIACGSIREPSGTKPSFIQTLTVHLSGLFATRRIGISTALIWLSWTLIGLAYPLYQVFLPEYLASRGAHFGVNSNYITWRNYAIVNMCGVWGPVLAGYLCNLKVLGRKGTMVVGALVTMAFFFAYTQVRSEAQNLGFTCAISFCLNIYYGCLYAYTPEVLPSAHRGTGNGIAVGCNRIMGIVSAIVAEYAGTATSVPIYICAALYIVMAFVALMLPFEPYGRRSS